MAPDDRQNVVTVAEVVREAAWIIDPTDNDALATLTEKGLLRRIQPSGSPARYERRVGDNHHHLICRVCDRTVDVDCSAG